MKRSLLCLLLALVLLCTTGCSDWEAADDPLGELSSFYQTENDEPEPEPLTALTLPYVSGETLDPVTATDTVQQTVGALLYEGLFALDQQFQPQPVLADSWEYDSQRLVWTIRIRADALFSDGSAVTAQDVAATLERARTSARYAQRLEDVTGVAARNGAVMIWLSRPLSTMPCRLDIPVVKSGTESRAVPVGSGPYVFAQDDGGAYLTASTLWWQDAAVPLTEIRLQHCKDRNSALYAFSSREIQLLVLDLTASGPERFPFSVWSKLQREVMLDLGEQLLLPLPNQGVPELHHTASDGTGVSGSGDYTEIPTPVMQFIGMNTRRTALEDPALRRALSAGIDRATLVSSCLLGQGTAAQLPASPAYSGYDTALEAAYSAAAYTRALNEALGEPRENEKPRTLTLLVNQENSFKVTAAEEVAFSLSNQRLTVTVDAVPWDTFLSRLQDGNFDLYYGECRLTADWDVSALVGWEGSLNYGGWGDEETERLLSLCRTAEGDSRNAALHDLWEHLLDTAPFAPVCFKSLSVLTTEGVFSGLTPTETNPFFRMGRWSVQLEK